MKSKYIYYFFLILVTVATNPNSCTELQKRFGCHNFSSINKIVNMNSNMNELSRNLERCMRGTGTYNKKNLDIAKKLQNDFESPKTSWANISKEVALAISFVASVMVLGFGSAELWNSFLDDKYNAKKSTAAIIFSSLTSHFFLKNLFTQEIDKWNREIKNKQLAAINIKKFVDGLQKEKILVAQQNSEELFSNMKICTRLFRNYLCNTTSS